MAKVSFYLLAENQSMQEWACQLATNAYRNKQRCLIYCDTQTEAEQIDELLWQLPVDAFVPHNLVGEGAKSNAPVELAWSGSQFQIRPVVINLSQSVPDFANQARQILDFVPFADEQKAIARDRYKIYRQQGHQLDTLPASK